MVHAGHWSRRTALGVLGSAAVTLAAGPGRAATALKFSSPAPTTDPAHTAAEYFAKQLAERTSGELTLRIFPGGQLGQHREVIQGLQSGAIELAFFATTFLVPFVKEFAALDLPYVITRREQVPELLDGELGKLLLVRLEKAGLVGLGFSEASFRSLITRRPLRGPADLNGLKIRVPTSPLFLSTFKAMGALPTPISFGEMYSALQQGVVDGAETTITAYYAYKFHEVAPHFYFSNHMLGSGIFIGSARALSRLSDQQRATVMSTGAEAALHHRTVEWDASDRMMDQAKAAGATFDNIEISGWRDATRKLHAEYEDRIGADVMTRLRAVSGAS